MTGQKAEFLTRPDTLRQSSVTPQSPSTGCAAPRPETPIGIPESVVEQWPFYESV
jgi:hypothetical protein